MTQGQTICFVNLEGIKCQEEYDIHQHVYSHRDTFRNIKKKKSERFVVFVHLRFPTERICNKGRHAWHEPFIEEETNQPHVQHILQELSLHGGRTGKKHLERSIIYDPGILSSLFIPHHIYNFTILNQYCVTRYILNFQGNFLSIDGLPVRLQPKYTGGL